MIKKWIGLSLYCCMLNASADIVVTQSNGQAFTLPKPAQRIISLAPSITELLFAAGGAGKVVGVSAYSDYPDEAKHIPLVGDSRELDIERIIALKPDLLIAWAAGSSSRSIDQLKKLGIPVFISGEHKLIDIPQNVQILGRLMGTEFIANQSANSLRTQLNLLVKQYANLSPIRLFYQVSDKPLITLNGQHIVSDAIHACGGINIFAELSTIAPNISIETVLEKNPEAIVTTADQTGAVIVWQRYPGMTAVKQGNVFTIDGNLINRAGPRMVAGVAALCEVLDKARYNRR